jgi:hypothetical protein
MITRTAHGRACSVFVNTYWYRAGTSCYDAGAGKARRTQEDGMSTLVDVGTDCIDFWASSFTNRGSLCDGWD